MPMAQLAIGSVGDAYTTAYEGSLGQTEQHIGGRNLPAVAVFRSPIQRDAVTYRRCANIHIHVLSHLPQAGNATSLLCTISTF